ncbi:DHS-like NAD/FAD-binding domain-containing protein [Lipomyces oligophaga]|uniref:DHS-like NAD/FAD-binding domain-containing protein n=1 Tax=Lipomyces oligophaga TaxID=45792 RepID=UPI0034CD10C3
MPSVASSFHDPDLNCPPTIADMAGDLVSFHACLRSSTRILALVGAGLSASSGLPTFRGSGGLWRNHDAMDLATPDAFSTDPSLVWQFYSARRAAALRARPNRAHYALAELARRNSSFLMLTQNVDGLSVRSNHPPQQLLQLHGSLFTLKCTSFYCDYVDSYNTRHPLTPALASCDDLNSPYIHIPQSQLPHCPKCHAGLLRPGVVWFGESLPYRVVEQAEQFFEQGKVDLILVIGTSGTVYPAAGYVDRVRQQGGKVAIFNIESDVPLEEEELSILESESTDSPRFRRTWVFHGDAAEWVPRALEPVVGVIPDVDADNLECH